MNTLESLLTRWGSVANELTNKLREAYDRIETQGKTIRQLQREKDELAATLRTTDSTQTMVPGHMVAAAFEYALSDPAAYRKSGETNEAWMNRVSRLLRESQDTAFAMGQQDAKNNLLRDVGKPAPLPENPAPPGKPYAEVNVGLPVSAKAAEHLGTIRLATSTKVEPYPPPVKHGDFKPLSASGKTVTVLKTEWDHLLAFKQYTYSQFDEERKTLSKVGLMIDYGDFGDGPGYLRSTEPPRRDIVWKPFNRVMVHYKGIPVYASGLLGTHPDNWKLVK